MKFDAFAGHSGIVRDAEGNVLPHPVSGNTVTGRCVCLRCDRYGRILLEDDGKPTRVTLVFRPPLTIEQPPQFATGEEYSRWLFSQPIAKPLTIYGY